MAIGDSRKDIAWKFSNLADLKNNNDLPCNFCGKTPKGGHI